MAFLTRDHSPWPRERQPRRMHGLLEGVILLIRMTTLAITIGASRFQYGIRQLRRRKLTSRMNGVTEVTTSIVRLVRVIVTPDTGSIIRRIVAIMIGRRGPITLMVPRPRHVAETAGIDRVIVTSRAIRILGLDNAHELAVHIIVNDVAHVAILSCRYLVLLNSTIKNRCYADAGHGPIVAGVTHVPDLRRRAAGQLSFIPPRRPDLIPGRLVRDVAITAHIRVCALAHEIHIM